MDGGGYSPLLPQTIIINLIKKDVTFNTKTTTPTIQLTHGQQSAFNEFLQFIHADSYKAYILRGYAGTGKTTLVKTFIDELQKQQREFILLASTGRAAKIMANVTGCQTSTIHGLIYKFDDLNQDMEKYAEEQSNADERGQLYLNFDLCPITLDEERVYLVDESSMISDEKDDNENQAIFGSGCLLTDLFEYDPKGKFVFIGDACQLPPISQSFSPALSATYLESKFGYRVLETELTEIVRQSEGNDIVQSAQQMRKLYLHPQPWKWAKFPLKGYKNIHVLGSTAELYREYLETIKSEGYEEATLLSFSNKQCSTVTDIIRPSLGIEGKRLSVGDLLLVTQNNYISSLMNGDQVTVKSIHAEEHRAGLTFLHVEVQEMFTGKVYSQLLVEDILYCSQTNLTQYQQKALYIDFYKRMKDKNIKQKDNAFKMAMMKDPYLNAIRAVYGYSLTCHKAQGGEWKKVFLDIPRCLPLQEKPYVYQWMYTAMTRACGDLYVVGDFYLF